MRITILLALLLASCGGSTIPADPAPAGAAGTSGMAGAAPATGAAGIQAADPCVDLPACHLESGQLFFDVGSSRTEFSSPTCPGRICAPCGADKAAGRFAAVHGCHMPGADGTYEIYCDDSASVIAGTDCNQASH